MAVWDGAVFVDRTLAASASATEDGVTVVSGTSGSITITLNSTVGIAAGESVLIELGEHATFEATSTSMFTNPSALGSYRIDVATKDAGNGALDATRAMIAIVAPVSITAVGENIPPVRSSGLPTGIVAAGNDEVEISLETNEIATCRYAESSGISYDDMTAQFASAGGTLFYAVVTGLQNNTSYTFYVRCRDFYGTVNIDDYAITFSLAENPISNTSIAQQGSGTGEGPIAGGSPVLYLAAVTLSGLAPPQSTVAILRDGVAATTASAGSDGTFSAHVAGLERGVYTFLTYATDSAGRKSAPVSSTITLGQGTSNTVSNLFLPPTIALEESSQSGADSRAVGASVPESTVEVSLRTGGAEKKYTAASGGSGSSGAWGVTIPAGDIRGAGSLRARARLGDRVSESSAPISIGSSEAGAREENASGEGGDSNGDGKVNLVDFSIMLSSWGTNDERVDLNKDGTVNLADFSILLFNWTG
jgi:hypothetical protein